MEMYLRHYGTKGQKWGYRRWQNVDGSYTAAGRIHYGIGAAKKYMGKAGESLTSLGKSAAKSYNNVKIDALDIANRKGVLDFLDSKASDPFTAIRSGTKSYTNAQNRSFADSFNNIRRYSGYMNENNGTTKDRMRIFGLENDVSLSDKLNNLTGGRRTDHYKDIVNRYKESNSESSEGILRNVTARINAIDNWIDKQSDKSVDARDWFTSKGVDDFFERYATAYVAPDRDYWVLHDSMDKNYISHHGIKGMHWGERRWQNMDGSLTPEGVLRYGKNLASRGAASIRLYGVGNTVSKAGKSFSKKYNSLKIDALDIANRKGVLDFLDSKASDPFTAIRSGDHGPYTKANRRSIIDSMDNISRYMQGMQTKPASALKNFAKQNSTDLLKTMDRLSKDPSKVSSWDKDFVDIANDYRSKTFDKRGRQYDHAGVLNRTIDAWIDSQSYNNVDRSRRFDEYSVGDFFSKYTQEYWDPYTSYIRQSSMDEEAYLSHHGTKNMKWGQRRYQNTDGSLTPLGRLHYGVGAARGAAGKVGSAIRKKVNPNESDLAEKYAKVQANNQKKAMKKAIKEAKHGKKIEDMTSAEIDAEFDRLRRQEALKAYKKQNSAAYKAGQNAKNVAAGAAYGTAQGVKLAAKGVGFTAKLAGKAVGPLLGLGGNLAMRGLKKAGENWVDGLVMTEAEKAKRAADMTKNMLNAAKDEYELNRINSGEYRTAQFLKEQAENAKNQASIAESLKKAARTSDDRPTMEDIIKEAQQKRDLAQAKRDTVRANLERMSLKGNNRASELLKNSNGGKKKKNN